MNPAAAGFSFTGSCALLAISVGLSGNRLGCCVRYLFLISGWSSGPVWRGEQPWEPIAMRRTAMLSNLFGANAAQRLRCP